MKKIGIMILLFSAAILSAQAPQFQGALHLSLGVPQNEFADQLDAVGFGGGGSFLYRIPNTGVSFGAGLDFFIYGNETRSEPWSMTIPDVTVDVTTTNSILQGFLMMRLQPTAGAVMPYADGLFGFNYLSTSTNVKSEWSDKEIASSTNYDDGALCYGGGAGLLIHVYQSKENIEINKREFGVYIDLGFRYLKGGEASYLKKGDIERTSDAKVIYHPSQSTTDIVTYNLGVSFAF